MSSFTGLAASSFRVMIFPSCSSREPYCPRARFVVTVFVRSSRCVFCLAVIVASLVLHLLVRGRSVEFVFGWIMSGRSSPRDFVGTVRGSVRNS